MNSLNLAKRRLITPAKRIVIWKVIPQELVEKVLTYFGFQLASPVSFLKAGVPILLKTF